MDISKPECQLLAILGRDGHAVGGRIFSRRYEGGTPIGWFRDMQGGEGRIGVGAAREGRV